MVYKDLLLPAYIKLELEAFMLECVCMYLCFLRFSDIACREFDSIHELTELERDGRRQDR